MTLTTIVILNLVLSALTMLAVYGLVRLAHRLPATAPHDDEKWGRGLAWVPSDPLPLAQLSAHEDERKLARAA